MRLQFGIDHLNSRKDAPLNRTCLFTGEELPENTKLEHGIPESLNGRIASKEVTSTAFNEFRGKELVPEMEAAYKFLINTLAPLMPKEFQKNVCQT